MFGGASFIYRLFYWVFRGFHGSFFRSIYVEGKETPDWSKPTLVACTHPNSFLDAVVYADSIKPPMHFLARGDVFKKGFVNWLFIRNFNMIPIYRRHETDNSDQKNKGIFRWVYRLLGENANIMIFTEGHSVPEKRIRPLKKGTAWMAFGTIEEQGTELDPYIVPVTLNYQKSTLREQTIVICYCRPIRVMDFWDTFQNNNSEGVAKLTEAVKTSLHEKMVILSEPAVDELGNTVLDIVRNDAYEPQLHWLRKNIPSASLKAEYPAANKVNTLYKEDPAGFETMEAKAKEYESQLKANKLHDEGLSPGQALEPWEKLLLLIGFPVFLASRILTSWPKRIGHWFVEKRKLRGTQWFLSIAYGIEFLLFTIAYFTAVGLVFSYAGTIWGWISVPMLILISIYGERYATLARRWRRRLRWKGIRRRKPQIADSIWNLREELANFGKA